MDLGGHGVGTNENIFSRRPVMFGKVPQCNVLRACLPPENPILRPRATVTVSSIDSLEAPLTCGQNRSTRKGSHPQSHLSLTRRVYLYAFILLLFILSRVTEAPSRPHSGHLDWVEKQCSAPLCEHESTGRQPFLA